MINKKITRQPKKILIVFYCAISMAMLSIATANEHEKEATAESSGNLEEKNNALEKKNRELVEKSRALFALCPEETSCQKKIRALRNIPADSPEYIEVVQCAVNTYRNLTKTKENNACKPVFKKNLRELTKTLYNRITLYEKISLKEMGNEVPSIRKKKKIAEDMLSILEEVIPTAELEEEIIVTFEDYPAFSINLYGGIESQSVDTVTSPDIPRLGLLVYQSNNNDKRKGFHIYGNFLLTGSAEATENVDNDPDQTLEMNLNVFWARWENKLDDKYALIGPVVSAGALRTSAKNEIYMPKKRYVGIRSALNPETYAEILYGTTSGLKSRRLELRLQAPIERFKNGSRIFVGAVFNMAFDKRIAGEPETASVYLSWHVPFGKLWNVNDDE